SIPLASSRPGGRVSFSTSLLTISTAWSMFPDCSNFATLTYMTVPSCSWLSPLPQPNGGQDKNRLLGDRHVDDAVRVRRHALSRRDEPVGVRVPDQEVDGLRGRETGDRVGRRRS